VCVHAYGTLSSVCLSVCVCVFMLMPHFPSVCLSVCVCVHAYGTLPSMCLCVCVHAYGTLSVGVSECVCVMLPTPKSLSNRLTNYNEDEVQVVWNNTPCLLAKLPTFRKTSLPSSSESDLRNIGHINSHGVTFQKIWIFSSTAVSTSSLSYM
jgi:hypothetical protein